jgi:TolB-like protein/tetratricopeptide (TPR) repeat protein
VTEAPTERAGESPWAKLRRRKVVQWGIVYAAGAWGLLQGLEYVSSTFDWPRQLQQFATLTLLIGLPIVLVTAWYHGDQGRQKVSAAELIIITLLFLVGGGIFWRYDRASHAPAPSTASIERPGITPGTPSVVAARSIAVLPFVNMSGDPGNEYFSDGISEEILNVLAGTPELQVAARTSSFSFKGKSMEVPEIAGELKVRMVLEGSVRKQGDKVRITAQLIDAQNGFHVWSQTYDRKLEDIFAIQDEIARAIGDELKVKIAGVAKPGQTSGGTQNLVAYDLYLRGMALWHTRGEQELWKAVDLFDQAAVADPTFAQAYAGLALTYTILPSYSARISWADAVARSSDFALRALALDPALPEAYAALASNSMNDLQRATADALLQRAIAIRPSFATAHQWRGNALLSSGDLAGGLESMERASTLDPRSAVIGDNHAMSLLTLGRYKQARERCERVLEFAPTFSGCLQYSGIAALLLGDFAAARPMLERLAAVKNPSASSQGRDLAEALAGRADRHELGRRMAALPFNSNVNATSGNALEDQMVAAVLMMLGENALALDFMERMAGNLGNTMDWAVMLPVMDPIRCEPRFVALVTALQTFDPYAAKVCAGKH